MKTKWVIKRKYEPNLFPKALGSYVFVKEIKKPFRSNNYFHAIYKSQDGKYFFAKLCKKRFGYEYYAFKNEIKVYRILYKSYKKAFKSIPPELNYIKIPKFISSFENNKILGYLAEFVDGEIINFKGKGGFHNYEDLLSILSIIDKHISVKDRKKIPRRTSLQVSLIYYFVLIKAIFENPSSTLNLLVGALHFTSSLPHLFSENTLSFVHRDLHAGNVLRNKSGTYIVDFQLSVLTNRIHEYTHTLRVEFDKTFTFKLTNYALALGDARLFRSSMIYSMTHALSAGESYKHSSAKWNKFLKQAINKI